MKNAGINPCNASEIQKQLLFAETISKEIQEAVNEKKNKKESIRTLISGKILKKYRLPDTLPIRPTQKKTVESKWKSHESYQT